jgi:hypothetical protein
MYRTNSSSRADSHRLSESRLIQHSRRCLWSTNNPSNSPVRTRVKIVCCVLCAVRSASSVVIHWVLLRIALEKNESFCAADRSSPGLQTPQRRLEGIQNRVAGEHAAGVDKSCRIHRESSHPPRFVRPPASCASALHGAVVVSLSAPPPRSSRWWSQSQDPSKQGVVVSTAAARFGLRSLQTGQGSIKS